jgi:hypothetical protein
VIESECNIIDYLGIKRKSENSGYYLRKKRQNVIQLTRASFFDLKRIHYYAWPRAKKKKSQLTYGLKCSRQISRYFSLQRFTFSSEESLKKALEERYVRE